MRAVVWTDVVQMFLYIFGAALSLYLLLDEIPGGWSHVAAVAEPLGKLRVFDFRLAPPALFFSRTYSFWAGIIGGCFLTTASHGTQRRPGNDVRDQIAHGISIGVDRPRDAAAGDDREAAGLDLDLVEGGRIVLARRQQP